MLWVEFIWFERPLEKIAEHGITRAEVEPTLRRAPEAAIARSAASKHMVLRWTTPRGRPLMVVFDWVDARRTVAVPVTAYEPE